jgi:hypothetical protein
MTDTDATFYQLPAVMPVPHRPQNEEDVLRWSKEMHEAIYDNYIPQTDRIENMIMIGETLSERPAAIGSRRLFYYRPAAELYLDTRYGGENYWDLISTSEEAAGQPMLPDPGTGTGGDADGVDLDTSNFDEVLSALDENVQLAMDTIDDHLHLNLEVAPSQPADVDLDNGEAIFWIQEV